MDSNSLNDGAQSNGVVGSNDPGSSVPVFVPPAPQGQQSERNRYVDFLRAYSILGVVLGHWLMATPVLKGESFNGGNLLADVPWTQYSTWLTQVMPIFFLVGGFANSLSWSAHSKRNGSYSEWIAVRAQRLVKPVLPLLLFWAALIMLTKLSGLDTQLLDLSAQFAIVPVWFLSVYLLVTAATPWAHAMWQRFGISSFWTLVALAAAIDVATSVFGLRWINLANFMIIWIAIHQLGFAWRDGYFKNARLALYWGLGGLLSVLLLVGLGPYPVSMVPVPGQELSNLMPPTMALLALGTTQIGFVLALEPKARRMLDNESLWQGVSAVNSRSMTIYLWHITALEVVIGLSLLLGGLGLSLLPTDPLWWLSRPIWFLCYGVALLLLIRIFLRFEASGKSRSGGILLWQSLAGLALISAGLGLTAAYDISDPESVTGVRYWLVALPLLGAILVGGRLTFATSARVRT